jgi:hypothetical protein
MDPPSKASSLPDWRFTFSFFFFSPGNPRSAFLFLDVAALQVSFVVGICASR